MDIENAVITLRKNNLEAKPSKERAWISGNLNPKSEKLKRKFMITIMRSYWVGLIEGPWGASTIVRISPDLQLVTEAVIDFYDITRHQQEKIDNILMAISKLQEKYLCVEIAEKNKLYVYETDLPAQEWWDGYEFMLNCPLATRSLFATLSLDGGMWQLRIVVGTNESLYIHETLSKCVNQILSNRSEKSKSDHTQQNADIDNDNNHN